VNRQRQQESYSSFFALRKPAIALHVAATPISLLPT